MSLNKLFDLVEQARDAANWKSAFGEPQVVDDKTIIPVAQVTYGFGWGFRRKGSESEDEGEPAEGSEGGGGSASAKPCGAIVVTPDGVYFEDTRDDRKIAILGIALSAFIVFQVTKTLRAVFGR